MSSPSLIVSTAFPFPLSTTTSDSVRSTLSGAGKGIVELLESVLFPRHLKQLSIVLPQTHFPNPILNRFQFVVVVVLIAGDGDKKPL